MRKFLLPSELIMMFGSLVAILLILIFDFSIYLPSSGVQEKLQEHFEPIFVYNRVLLLGFLIYMAVAIREYSANKDKTRKEPLLKLLRKLFVEYFRIVIAFTICLILMTNFKLWALLANDVFYDEFYQQIDKKLGFIISLLKKAVSYIWLTDKYYFLVYANVFTFGFIVAGAYGKESLHKIVNSVLLIFIFGGLSYMVAPAYGPFTQELSTYNSWYMTQQYMLDFSAEFRMTYGLAYTGADFPAALGAMPSLHVAHAVAIALNISKVNKYISAMFWLAAFYILVFAVISQFHYLLDIVVGLVIGVLAFYGSQKLADYWKSSKTNPSKAGRTFFGKRRAKSS